VDGAGAAMGNNNGWSEPTVLQFNPYIYFSSDNLGTIAVSLDILQPFFTRSFTQAY
jgi:hypothetical protein